MTTTVAFLFGALAMGYAVLAIFFTRYWRKTGDRLFLFFVAAFLLLGLERVLAVATARVFEGVPWLYVIRLAAFLIIVMGILDKNRRP